MIMIRRPHNLNFETIFMIISVAKNRKLDRLFWLKHDYRLNILISFRETNQQVLSSFAYPYQKPPLCAL